MAPVMANFDLLFPERQSTDEPDAVPVEGRPFQPVAHVVAKGGDSVEPGVFSLVARKSFGQGAIRSYHPSP